MTTQTMRRGARIETTGEGRTSRWAGWTGTVTSVRQGYIFVKMDVSRFSEEQFEPREVRLLGTRPVGCPCGQCIHS